MGKEGNTKNFVLRVDAATMEALERWAGDEFRSINGQLQWIIAEALRRAGRTPERKSEHAHADKITCAAPLLAFDFLPLNFSAVFFA